MGLDVLVAVVVALLDALSTSTSSDPFGASRPWTAILPVAAAAALVLRRRRPLLVAALVIALDLGVTGSDTGHALLAVAVVAYTVGLERSLGAGWATAAVAVVLSLVALVVSARPYARTADTLDGRVWVYVLELSVACLLAMVMSAWIGTRRRYLSALVELARRLALERDQRGRLAVGEERARIAREMHDIVGHGLSVMIRLADGAGGVMGSDPERAHAATDLIASTGRSSLAELRRTLGVLRATPELEPQPTASDLDELVERFRAAGLPVALRRTGPVDRLTGGVGLVVHRAVQEALTNALRHARTPGRVLVEVVAQDGDVVVTVTDDGGAAPEGAGVSASEGSGRGLLGLRERAAMFGGAVTAGPRPNGGWRVRVTLPDGAGRSTEKSTDEQEPR